MNASVVDYLMPTINMMPRIETTLVHGYPGAGPYGTKDTGEIACVPPMAPAKSHQEKRTTLVELGKSDTEKSDTETKTQVCGLSKC